MSLFERIAAVAFVAVALFAFGPYVIAHGRQAPVEDEPCDDSCNTWLPDGVR